MKKRTKITFSLTLVICLLLSILPAAPVVAAEDTASAISFNHEATDFNNSRPNYDDALTIHQVYATSAILDDGIYQISSSLSGFNIGAHSSIANNTSVTTGYPITSAPQNLIQLWKITYLGGGMYSIRPLYAQNMALSATTSGIRIQEIGTTDTLSGVPASARWTIAYNATGYKLLNNAQSSSAMMLTSATVLPDVSISVGEFSADSIQCRWNFTEVSNPSYGAWFYDTSVRQFVSHPTKKIEYGSSKALSAINLLPTVFTADTSTQSFTWTSSDPSIVSTNQQTGFLTSTSTGQVTLTGTAELDGTQYTISITLFSILPLSGSELAYDEDLWSGIVKSNCNCYAYAINNQVNPDTGQIWYKQQPGEYSGVSISGYLSTPSVLANAATADFQAYSTAHSGSYTFTSIGRFDRCPTGTYKVALVITDYKTGNYDYHWYRQNSDGLWSHKYGTTSIQNCDDNGNCITDPYTAERGDYTVWVGYYAVSPWNGMYTASSVSSTTNSNIAQTVQPDAPNLIGTDQISQLEIGMTLSEVATIIGNNGEDIGSGTIILKYQTASGSEVFISFCIDAEGIYRVINIQTGGNTL